MDNDTKNSDRERTWRRLTVEMHMTDDEYRQWNIDSTNPQVRIVDYDEIVDHRNPEGTMRMHNSPRHGPLKLLRLAWRRLRQQDTGR